MQFSYENEQFNPGFTWTGCFIRRFFSKLHNYAPLVEHSQQLLVAIDSNSLYIYIIYNFLCPKCRSCHKAIMVFVRHIVVISLYVLWWPRQTHHNTYKEITTIWRTNTMAQNDKPRLWRDNGKLRWCRDMWISRPVPTIPTTTHKHQRRTLQRRRTCNLQTTTKTDRENQNRNLQNIQRQRTEDHNTSQP